MFNVLIVDDDAIVLDCLTQFVNWPELGFRIAGTALSAGEAINRMEAESVDVILTDIVMPKQDGLGLIRDALQINPYIKTVVLSSHIDFHFAKEAMRLGSFDYLTKPVNFEELAGIFHKLKAVLEQEQQEKRKQNEYQRAMRAQFLNNLANGFFHRSENIDQKAAEIGLLLKQDAFCLIRLRMETLPFSAAGDGDELFNECKADISNEAAAFLEKVGKVYLFDNIPKEVAILFYPKDESIYESTLEQFSEVIGHKGGVNVFTGVGGLYRSLDRAAQSFNEAGKALEYRFLKRDRYLSFNRMKGFFKGRSVINAEVEENIQDFLINGDSTGLEGYIQDILLDLYRMEDTQKGILYDGCIEIVLIVNKFLLNHCNREKAIPQNDYTAIRALLKQEDYEEVKAYLSEYIRESMAALHEDKEKPMGVAIESVLQYINEHYNEDITLQKLSEIAYVHPIYLCKLFKEKTGENFVEYLMRVRVEKAKHLLGNLSLRIYDICEMVGYDSPQHFSKVFKEIVGLAPKDYRKNGYKVQVRGTGA